LYLSKNIVGFIAKFSIKLIAILLYNFGSYNPTYQGDDDHISKINMFHQNNLHKMAQPKQ